MTFNEHKRRDKILRLQRVNLKKLWLIKKPGRLSKMQMVVPALLLAALLSIKASSPVQLVFIVIVIVIVLSLILKIAGIKTNSTDDNTPPSGTTDGTDLHQQAHQQAHQQQLLDQQMHQHNYDNLNHGADSSGQ